MMLPQGVGPSTSAGHIQVPVYIIKRKMSRSNDVHECRRCSGPILDRVIKMGMLPVQCHYTSICHSEQ
jgi:hypothetical protein